MSKLPIEYLRHIYDECEFINRSISPDMTKDDLIDNEVLKRAIVRSLEIIGESTKKIPRWRTGYPAGAKVVTY